MKTLKVFGASDDLIECEGIEGCDEFNVYPTTAHAGKLVVSHGGRAMLGIHAIYAGAWAFAVMSDDRESDNCKMPDWPITRTWGKDSGYSETLSIEVPDDAVLSFPGHEQEGEE